jgi:hypothetical protein
LGVLPGKNVYGSLIGAFVPALLNPTGAEQLLGRKSLMERCTRQEMRLAEPHKHIYTCYLASPIRVQKKNEGDKDEDEVDDTEASPKTKTPLKGRRHALKGDLQDVQDQISALKDFIIARNASIRPSRVLTTRTLVDLKSLKDLKEKPFNSLSEEAVQGHNTAVKDS